MQTYLNKYKKFRSFLGERVWALLLVSIFVGFFWFLVDWLFIFVMQAFLVAIGLVNREKAFLPDFFDASLMNAVTLLLVFGFLRALMMMARAYFSEVTNQAFLRTQRERILELALSNASHMSTPTILNVFNERIPVASHVLQNLSSAANTTIACICFLVLGLKLAPKELVLGCIILGTLFLFLRFINEIIQGIGVTMINETKAQTRTLTVGLKNHFLLKVYQKTAREISNGKTAIRNYETLYRRFIFLASLKSAFPQFAGALVVAAICFASSRFFHTPSAKLVSLIYIFIRLGQGLSEWTGIAMSIRFNWGSFKELYHWHLIAEDFMDQSTPPVRLEGVASTRKFAPIFNDGPIRLEAKSVGFSYLKKAPIFSDLSFSTGTGEILLIKGASGSGKSTLLTLLLGIQTPTKGHVLINGMNPSEVRSDLASVTGYVGPDPFLIEGTVRENLVYSAEKSDYSDSELLGVLEKARLGDLFKSNGMGLSTHLGEFAELSTGQKQRLAIARALLRNPRLLVLDEATSNLDPSTEREIIECVKEISNESMIIVVSHKDTFDHLASQTIWMQPVDK